MRIICYYYNILSSVAKKKLEKKFFTAVHNTWWCAVQLWGRREVKHYLVLRHRKGSDYYVNLVITTSYKTTTAYMLDTAHINTEIQPNVHTFHFIFLLVFLTTLLQTSFHLVNPARLQQVVRKIAQNFEGNEVT